VTSIPSRSKRKLRRPERSLASAALVLAIASAGTGCAAKRFAVPLDAGVPVAGYESAWQAVAAPCLGVRTMTAELGLSGRAGGTRMRGRVQAGFQSPGRIRLEGVAPFGQPVFILVADGTRATLLLPRDERVVRASEPAEILEALAGVRLDPDALRAVLAGCTMTAAPTAATGHGEIVRFQFPGGTVYARRNGNDLRIVAAETQSFLIEYPDAFVAGSLFPRRVRISRSGAGADNVDLTIALSQVESNISLPDAAFTIDVPPGTMPMTIADLRAAGPLGARN
jgi:outer membrane lipoprotein-sorting protein